MVDSFRSKLENRGIRVYLHRLTEGYPLDVDTIVSERGYGRNPYIETSRPLIVMTAPGPNSGKLATCLSQLYMILCAAPRPAILNLRLPDLESAVKHPVNIAYESATADLRDVNMIDPSI